MNTPTTYLDHFVDALRLLAKVNKEYRKTQPDFVEIRRILMSNKIGDLRPQYEALREKLLRPLAESYLSRLGGHEAIANKCHSLSSGFLATWQQVDTGDFPLTITIGNVFYKGENIFNLSKSSLKRTLNEGVVTDKALNAHVWLTWDDTTVVDLSIISTLIRREKLVPSNGMPLALIWSDHEPGDYWFEPLLVDNNFFEKVDGGELVFI